ncbi:ribonuclease HII [Candidatus Bipolaricaulota sp. J31]
MAVKVLGIDEAGRGALFGPLIVAGVLVAGKDLERLKERGASDSKGIRRERRRDVLLSLRELFLGARVCAIAPREIDEGSLTELELAAAVEIVGRLRPHVLVFDAPVSPRAIPRFTERLRSKCSLLGAKPREIIIVPKADRDFPVVGAASLLAKVTRDAYVMYLRRRYGDFGWGYPGEEAAVRFLRAWWERHGDLPPICRRKWATARRFLSPELGL